jgi:hypothetical protein
MRPEQNEMVPDRNEQASEHAGQRQATTRTEAHPEARTDTYGAETGATETRGTETRGTETRGTGARETASDREAHTEARAPAGTRTDDEPRERLVSADHAAAYGSRWDAVKGTFVDEPREAVAQADALVGEVLDELETLFREQRQRIERDLDSDEASTEDLRLALRRYRSFFDRLLAV